MAERNRHFHSVFSSFFGCSLIESRTGAVRSSDYFCLKDIATKYINNNKCG